MTKHLPQVGGAIFQLPSLRQETLFVWERLYPISHLNTAMVVFPSDDKVIFSPVPAESEEHSSEDMKNLLNLKM